MSSISAGVVQRTLSFHVENVMESLTEVHPNIVLGPRGVAQTRRGLRVGGSGGDGDRYYPRWKFKCNVSAYPLLLRGLERKIRLRTK